MICGGQQQQRGICDGYAGAVRPKGDLACSKAKDGTLTSLGESDAASYDLPMAVLVDDTTVGTPELFALVIQQNSKGKVVGLTTAGQGSIQKDYKLIDGSGLVLTTALYATTDGETYNGVGVSPDYRVKLNVADSERPIFTAYRKWTHSWAKRWKWSLFWPRRKMP